jgi:hypothetical protein
MLFKNKNQNELNSLSEQENLEPMLKSEPDSLDWDNIFKELSWELDFWNSTEDSNKDKNIKDSLYYLKMWAKSFATLNIVLAIIVAISFLYVKVQNNPNLYSKAILDPFCFALLSDDMKNTWDYCSSVLSLSEDYKLKTEQLKNEIVSSLSLLSEDIYSIDNFIYSKEITFLMDAKANKLNVLNILNDFDKLKNDFSGWDKKMIVCDSINITKEYIDVTCNAYSSSWETTGFVWWWIVWSTWDRNSSIIEGTSISVASSFLNFIEKNPSYNFKIVERQKSFSSETIIWEWPYVRKTNFNFKLKYNNLLNNLSL